MSRLLQDLRFAARQHVRQPTFAIIAIATTALGIGAATTCFSVLNAVALRPPPFADPDGLVSVRFADAGKAPRARVSVDGFHGLREVEGIFSASVGYRMRAATLAASGKAERVTGAEVTGDIFSLLGRPVQLGRPLVEADSGTRAAVIDHDLWRRMFASDRRALGSTISVDGEKYTIVGVAGPDFSFPRDSRVWLSLESAASERSLDVVARLLPGVTLTQADAALHRATGSVPPTIAPLRQMMLGTKHRDMALFILSLAGLVLFIACANLGGLLTAHQAGRTHEIAVRAAIGADRGRIVRQLMTESLMLALAGGVLGVLLAQWGVALFATTLGKPQGADWIEFVVDGRVLAFALLASLLTALLFGLAPALGRSRVDLRAVLQQDRSAAGSPPRGRRRRDVLVAGQVALSIGLICGAASMVKSSMRFDTLDPGFRRDGLLVLRVALAGRTFASPEQRFAYIDAALARLRALPGATSVTATSHLPLADRDVPYATFLLDGTEDAARPSASVRFVDAGYVEAMNIPIRRGRSFTAPEARDVRARAVLINDTMARRYWPGREPVGARLRVTGLPEVEDWLTIVGVVGDVSQRQLPADPENQIYLPLAPARDVTLAIRVADPAAAAASARDALRSVDDSVAVRAQTMKVAYEWYVTDRRLQGFVLGTIGAIAVLMAALGIFGIVSMMVQERARELAIRTALGASTTAVMRLVLARALRLTAAGVGPGLLLATALTIFLSSIFLGVQRVDVMVLGGAATLLGTVALGAAWRPARRATRIDPIVALKA